MIEEKKWKRDEMAMLDQVLGYLPERHTKHNTAITQWVREDYLTGETKASLSAGGLYRVTNGSAYLYNPAVGGNFELGNLEIPRFDFTVVTLIGFSLFLHPYGKKLSAAYLYPKFDKGQGTSPKLKILDTELILRQLDYRSGNLYLDEKLVSLDQAFALCYTSYLVAPEYLLKSFPDVYQELKTTIFDGREYRKKGSYPGGGIHVLRV